jgi:hypothetical protein
LIDDILLSYLENDLNDGNADIFIKHFKSFIHQLDESGNYFSVVHYFSNLAEK